MRLNNDQIVFDFSKDHEPVLTVQPGDVVELETLDCFANQLYQPNASLDKLDWNTVNPVTGPIFIQDAMPGDTLKVTINKISIANQGVVACLENEGTVGHLITGQHFKLIDIQHDQARFNDDIQIPVKPMVGVIGVAPEGEAIGCGTPGMHGGNMDNTMIGQNTVLYLPVKAEGALFALGDVHAVMGDGEIGVTGLEIPAVVTVTFDVIKGRQEKYPVLEDEKTFSLIVSHKTIDEAAVEATELMTKFLEQRSTLTRPDVIMLLSLVGNLEICQVVDPLKTVRFIMPKQYINDLSF